MASHSSYSKTKAFQAAYRTVVRYNATVVQTVTACSVSSIERLVSLGCNYNFTDYPRHECG